MNVASLLPGSIQRVGQAGTVPRSCKRAGTPDSPGFFLLPPNQGSLLGRGWEGEQVDDSAPDSRGPKNKDILMWI